MKRGWGEAIGESASSVAIESPGLKGSERDLEAWYHVAVRVPKERLLVMVQHSCIVETSILEMPVPWMTTKDSGSLRVEPP